MAESGDQRVPYEVPLNTTLPLLVQRNTTYATPIQMNIAALHRDYRANEASVDESCYRLRDSGNQGQFIKPLLLQRLNQSPVEIRNTPGRLIP